MGAVAYAHDLSCSYIEKQIVRVFSLKTYIYIGVLMDY